MWVVCVSNYGWECMVDDPFYVAGGMAPLKKVWVVFPYAMVCSSIFKKIWWLISVYGQPLFFPKSIIVRAACDPKWQPACGLLCLKVLLPSIWIVTYGDVFRFKKQKSLIVRLWRSKGVGRVIPKYGAWVSFFGMVGCSFENMWLLSSVAWWCFPLMNENSPWLVSGLLNKK